MIHEFSCLSRGKINGEERGKYERASKNPVFSF